MKDLLNQILARHTGQALERIEKDTDRDFVLEADAAKEYGIIDEVISAARVRRQHRADHRAAVDPNQGRRGGTRWPSSETGASS